MTAHAEIHEDDPAAPALAEALLEPLVAWQLGGGRKAKAEGEPTDEPAPPPPPSEPSPMSV